tara:strand:+ start:22194 stop:22346 length:153 start_codon:yes stop_codon:yes gene_type:complete
MNEFWREADVIGSAKPKSPNGYSAHHHHVGRTIFRIGGKPTLRGYPIRDS